MLYAIHYSNDYEQIELAAHDGHMLYNHFIRARKLIDHTN